MIEKFDPLKGERFRIIDADGRADPDYDPRLSDADLRRIYSLMVTTRTADIKAFKLQRQGRMGTYAPSRGQEACQVGSGFALKPEDWLFPYFRDLGMYVTLGYPLATYFHYWMGNENGMKTPDGLNIFPLAIPVASQIPHAVGAGMAANIKKLRVAVAVTFGDGATSEGDFHEALNFAGVFKTPNVFICYNNQYAISVPRKKQTASPTIAQKALAYGFSGIQVDGNDVLAMYAAAREAMDKARAGLGPTLIEAYTYRLWDHTTSDDAAKYRDKSEAAEWEKKDPIDRFRAYLRNRGLWDETFEKEVQEKAAGEVEKAVAEAESRPPASIEDLFAFTYGSMTPGLKEQLGEATASAGEVPR
jgi:pyruvate dehydrogenase E1 component alpha subunit